MLCPGPRPWETFLTGWQVPGPGEPLPGGAPWKPLNNTQSSFSTLTQHSARLEVLLSQSAPWWPKQVWAGPVALHLLTLGPALGRVAPITAPHGTAPE